MEESTDSGFNAVDAHTCYEHHFISSKSAMFDDKKLSSEDVASKLSHSLFGS